MIRAETLRKTHALENLREFTVAFPGLFEAEIKSDFGRTIQKPLLSELRYIPAKLPSSPFVWSTNKTKQRNAQRYYRAAIKRGEIRTSGGHYQRTGEIAAGWTADILVGDGLVVMVIEHKAKTARAKRGLKWVTGHWQIPGHWLTGWVQHAKTILFWKQAAVEQVDKVIRRLLDRHLG